MNFFHVAEGLENQQINSCLNQSLDLLAECFASLLKRSLAERLNSGSQRANRSRHPHIEAFGGFTSQPHSRKVDFTNFVGQTVSTQAERVSTKCIGFNDFCAGLKVVMVNPANQVGLGKVQFVVRSVDEDALGVEQRSHGTIAEHGGLP